MLVVRPAHFDISYCYSALMGQANSRSNLPMTSGQTPSYYPLPAVTFPGSPYVDCHSACCVTQCFDLSVTHAAAGYAAPEGAEETGSHPRSRPPPPSLMRQGSHSSIVSTSRLDKASESGLLEQLMSYDNGLQVWTTGSLPA